MVFPKKKDKVTKATAPVEEISNEEEAKEREIVELEEEVEEIKQEKAEPEVAEVEEETEEEEETGKELLVPEIEPKETKVTVQEVLSNQEIRIQQLEATLFRLKNI